MRTGDTSNSNLRELQFFADDTPATTVFAADLFDSPATVATATRTGKLSRRATGLRVERRAPKVFGATAAREVEENCSP